MWRDWLAERCTSLKERNKIGSGPDTKAEEAEEYRQRLLWADTNKHVGMRLRVIEKEDEPEPMLMNRNEDPAISYILKYEGKWFFGDVLPLSLIANIYQS